jgi:hypothetical protein
MSTVKIVSLILGSVGSVLALRKVIKNGSDFLPELLWTLAYLSSVMSWE